MTKHLVIVLLFLSACSGQFHNGQAITGDSKVSWGTWEHLGICNHGISGDSTAGVRGRISELTEHSPKLHRVYIQVGRNSLVYYNTGLVQTFAEYRDIIEILLAHDIEVIVFSTIPDGGSSPDNNTIIADLNYLLVDYCNQIGIEYIDINKDLAPNGHLVYTDDEVHPNQQGYEIWYNIIRWII